MKNFLFIIFLFASSGGILTAQTFDLTLVHVNDTHSHHEPSLYKLNLTLDQGKKEAVTLELGGYSRIAETIGSLRQKDPHTLVLHAGDLFQGSLLFTRYQGTADTAFWNLVGLDAATLGNHEFDKGPKILRTNLFDLAHFPIVSCNIDWTQDQALGSLGERPFTILTVDGQKVGIMGATTPSTEYISSPGSGVRFTETLAAVQRTVDKLSAQGVNKIILLSHLGYEEDIQVAKKVSGIDVIVGGHSHTLLGLTSNYGGRPAGPYPTVETSPSGDRVLVVQAWEWGKAVGDLRVSFDGAGKVQGWKDSPVLVAGEEFFRFSSLTNSAGQEVPVQVNHGQFKVSDGKDFTVVPSQADTQAFKAQEEKILGLLRADPSIHFSPGSPQADQLLAAYTQPLEEFKSRQVAFIDKEMKRGLNTGPGTILTDAMAAKTHAQIALYNTGGVRTNLLPGPLTVGQIYELDPFANTLVIVRLTGREVVQVLEESLDFTMAKDGKDSPLVYETGLRLRLAPQKPKGQRVVEARLTNPDGSSAPLKDDQTYSVVVNSYMAAGGDKADLLKGAKNKVDTGFIDTEALVEFMEGKRFGDVSPRIEVVNLN